MKRALVLTTLLCALCANAIAGGVGEDDGPVKVTSLSRPVLSGKVLGITWIGKHGRTQQRLPTPRPLDALGAITPPPGLWDTVELRVEGLTLNQGAHRLSLPIQTLELVLTEPLQGGAQVQLQVDLELPPELLGALDGDATLRAEDPRLPALEVALRDGLALQAR